MTNNKESVINMRRNSRYQRLFWALLISWLRTCSASWTSRQTYSLTIPNDYNATTDLLCHLFLECLSKHDGVSVDRRAHVVDTNFDCKIVDSVFDNSIQYSSDPLRRIEIPEDFRRFNTGALEKGQWFVMMRNGKKELATNSTTINSAPVQAARESLITIPVEDDSSISARSSSSSSSVDVRSVLVLRVTTTDSEPTLLAQEMAGIIFNDTAPSLLTQPSWCSHGKILFQPSSYGVLDIGVDMSAAGSEADAIAVAAYTAANTMLGITLEEVYDHVMFCIPPGTNGKWIAYASVNYWRTVFNDVWCTYLSGYMHELGHNIGFYHSNQNGIAYKDASGYMSASYGQTIWPQKCYNGQNHWLKGWFRDRALDLPLQPPKIYNLATFVDYGKASGDEVVLIRIDQTIYLQYNRAKDFNKDTLEGQNDVMVVEYIPVVFPGTSLLTSLNNSTGPFQTIINGTNATVVIDVCELIAGDEYRADVAVVSVGAGFSLCYEYNMHLVTAAPISPVYLASPSQSPVYFKPSPVINEDFPTVTYDEGRTPRLHRTPQFNFFHSGAASPQIFVSFLAALNVAVGLVFA